MIISSCSQVLMELTGSLRTVLLTWEHSTQVREFMNSNIIPSKEHGLSLQDGLLALTSLMMSLVKSTKSFTSPKIWEILGNTSRAMSLTLHGELPHSLALLEERTLSQESSSLMTQTSKGTRRQEKDGSKAFISTTLMTSLRLRITLSMQVTAL